MQGLYGSDVSIRIKSLSGIRGHIQGTLRSHSGNIEVTFQISLGAMQGLYGSEVSIGIKNSLPLGAGGEMTRYPDTIEQLKAHSACTSCGNFFKREQEAPKPPKVCIVTSMFPECSLNVP
jgi:hypothetical protein